MLDDLIPVLQSSIDSLQNDLNPEETVLQKLLEQEIDRQEELLLRAEEVNDKLLEHLNLEDDEPTEDGLQEDISQQVRRQDYPLSVTISDEKPICLKKGSWTLARVIDRLGIERVMGLGIMSGPIPLVHPKRRRKAAQTRSGRYFIASNTSTAQKKEQLEEIKHRLNIQLEVKQLNIQEEDS